MDKKRWNDEGNRVKHKLSGWIGYIQFGFLAGLMDRGDNFTVADVSFWDPTRREFKSMTVLESEIEIL